MKPLILVVTPTLGNRDSLINTINSVKSFGGIYVRHVIIAPLEKKNDIITRFKDIEFCPEPENMKPGIYPALNYVFRKYGHDYDYMTFINDDDFWLPNFQFLIDYLRKHKEIDMIYGKVNFINEKNEIIGEQACASNFYNALELLESKITLIAQQATIFKSDYYFKIGGFSEKYKLISDTKFWIDMSLLKPKFKYVDKICASFMFQLGQLSEDRNLQRSETDDLLMNYNQYMKNNIIKLYSISFFRLSNLVLYIKRFIKIRL